MIYNIDTDYQRPYDVFMESDHIILNTKQDYLNLLQIDRIQGINRLQSLLDSRFTWQWVKDLAKDEAGIEDDMHKILPEIDEGEDGLQRNRMQFALKQYQHAEIFRLGFTVDEVEQLISNAKMSIENV